MALAVVVAALALALAARAEHYGGAAMPQYGAADYEHDYQPRSPDAPAPLDYKYREDAHGYSEKPVKYTGEVDHWRKSPAHGQRRPMRDEVDEELDSESNSVESESRGGRHRRPRRRRGRGRRDETRHERQPELHAALPARDQYLDDVDYRDDENKYLADNPTREKKLIGRKPRQRMFAPMPLDPNAEKNIEDSVKEEEGGKMVQTILDEVKDDADYPSGQERDRAGLDRVRQLPTRRQRPLAPGLGAGSDLEPSSGSEREDAPRDWRVKPVGAAAGNYPEYNDDDALKNIENIKNKLPTLLRRPTTMLPLRHRFSPGRAQWPARRAGQLVGPPLQMEPVARPTLPQSPSPSSEASSAPPGTTLPSPAPTRGSSDSSITFGSAATLASIDTAANKSYEQDAFIAPLNASALSMADKSRLSILKKAHMKESAWKTAPRKPPVLLQVTTRQVPTVVMVASADPWQDARRVFGDSPDTLQKVKRLMRQKLVAGAKNIRDLTDNWDEVVCDYIDVDMLERLPSAAPAAPAGPLRLGSLCTLVLSLVIVP